MCRRLFGKVWVNEPIHTRNFKHNKLVKRLVADVDYEVEPGKHRVSFTDRGVTQLEDWLGWKKADSGAASLYDGTRPELFYLTNALKALTLYHRGEDYMVDVRLSKTRNLALPKPSLSNQSKR